MSTEKETARTETQTEETISFIHDTIDVIEDKLFMVLSPSEVPIKPSNEEEIISSAPLQTKLNYIVGRLGSLRNRINI